MNRIYIVICILTIALIPFYSVHAQQTIGDSSLKKNYCIECHIALNGKPRAVVLEWENSIHARKNLECHICHGGNPQVNDAKAAKDKKANFTGKPKKKDIPEFCGREGCHDKALAQLKKGPHYDSVMKIGSPNCVDCHGDHNIQQSTYHIITDKTCSGCHSVEYSRELVNSIISIEKNIEDIERSLEYMNERNVETKDMTGRYVELKSYFHQLVHVFSKQEIDFTKKLVEVEIEYLDKQLKSKIASVKRLDLIYILTSAFSIGIIISFTVYIALIRRRRAKVQKNFQSR
ncbi:MAG: cytochrome c3 family protein [Spirochaetes bacterium]|nr:cytochrome c3 family protein [Spirochaetota bacterium]